MIVTSILAFLGLQRQHFQQKKNIKITRQHFQQKKQNIELTKRDQQCRRPKSWWETANFRKKNLKQKLHFWYTITSNKYQLADLRRMRKLACGTLSSSFLPATWKVVQNSLKLTKILTKGVANIVAKHAQRRRLTIHFVWPRKLHLWKQHNWDGMGQTSGYTVFHELIHIQTKIITF